MSGMPKIGATPTSLTEVPERLNPLLKRECLEAADEAACKLDGMFYDLFNTEERMDLIVTIIRAATRSMLTQGQRT